MQVQITLTGADGLTTTLQGMAANTQRNVEEAMKSAAEGGKSFMDSKTPVNKAKYLPKGHERGTLKKNNKVEANGLELTASNETEYGPFVEYGTHRMAAQPFFWPTIDYIQAQLEPQYERALLG